MNTKDSKILCVVPARGGSKGIPGKNLMKVGGVSLVGRAGLVCSELDCLTRSIISTDSADIATEATKYGLECPFFRPEHLAQDVSTSLDMWISAWKMAEEHYGENYDFSILLEPTSPLRRPSDVLKTVDLMLQGNCAAITVSRTPPHFSPEKTLSKSSDGGLNYYIGKGGLKFHNRQTIPEYFHRNGICYAVTRDHLLKKKRIIEGAAAVIIDRITVNIDEPFELELANWLLLKEKGYWE